MAILPPLGDLFLKVLVGLLDADIGDPDPHTDLLALGSGSIRDQADIGAGPLGLVRNRSALPGAVLTQRFGELGVEVGRNAAPATAASSSAAARLPGHCGRSHHFKFAAEADQEVRMSIRGKREPVVSRVLGHGGFRFDSIAFQDGGPVIGRGRFLVVVKRGDALRQIGL